MKHRASNYKELVIELKQHKHTIKQLKERNKLLSIDVGEERAVSKRVALLSSEIKQLKEANDFERDEIVRLKNEIKLPWFLAALLFSLLIWSLLL